jgi:hypothetical protein
MALTRRAFLGALATASLGLVAACASPAAAPPTSAPTRTPAVTPAAGGRVTLLVTNSEIAVGPNRFTVALIGSDNQPVTDAKVHLEFFQVSGGQGTKRGDVDATFRWVDQPSKGVYATRFSFPAAGDWGVQATADSHGTSQQARANFNVVDKPATPTIGKPALKSNSPIASDVGGDTSKICTNVPPCDLHALRIKDAVTSGKPSALLFATPGFCTSRTCAPMLGVVLQLRDRYREQADFVHVEIYKEPQKRVVADTVNEWGLQSEPWIFMVDKGGTIADRLEGTASMDELDASLKPLL